MIPDGAPTGLRDRYGRIIKIGDMVIDEDKVVGEILFINGAVRVNAHGGEYLKYNSSLVFSDSKDPKRLRVIKHDTDDKNQAVRRRARKQLVEG